MKETKTLTRQNIPIYCCPNPALHSFCIGLYTKAGVLYEDESQNGVSHFLEHILFRNLNETMGGALYETLDRLGLDFNGCTYKELIQFKITGAPSHFTEAARMLLRLFEPLTLPAAAIDLERKRIKAEIRENDDLHSLDFYTDQMIWEGGPLSRPIAGTPASLNRLHKKELEQARKEILSPGRIHFYLTGCISEDMVSAFCRLVDGLSFPEEKEEKRPADNCVPLPPSFQKREPAVFLKPARYCYVKLSFDFCTGRYESAVLDYLYDLLFLGDSCRTYLRLSEETGYVYSFEPCLEKYNNAGCLTLSFGTSGQNLMAAIETALSMFSDIRKELPDLSRVRPTYTDNLPMLFDQPEQLNWIGGYENHILNLPDTSLADRRRRYETVTPEQIQKAAREIFQKNNLSLAVKYTGKGLTKELLLKAIEASGL